MLLKGFVQQLIKELLPKSCLSSQLEHFVVTTFLLREAYLAHVMLEIVPHSTHFLVKLGLLPIFFI